jgi:hypothetical protein
MITEFFSIDVRVVYYLSHRRSSEEANWLKRINRTLSVLKGTLDKTVLRTLVGGNAHGHTIAKIIERPSEDVLEVEQGSLYPALHRLEDRGWVSSYWGANENNRKAILMLPPRYRAPA